MTPSYKRSTQARKPAAILLATGLVLFGMGATVRAEYPPPLIFGRIMSSSPEDLPIIREASAPLFDAATPGVTRDWSNPQTGNRGTIRLRRIFALIGMPCRTFDYSTWTKQHSDETQVTVDWCKVTDDGWKLMDPRDPASGSPAK